MSSINTGLTVIPAFGYQNTAVSVGGTLAETALYTLTIPGDTLGPNGNIRVIPLWTTTSSANNKTLKVKLSTTAFFSTSYTTQATVQMFIQIRNRNSTSSQVGMASGNTGFSTGSAGAVTTASIDTTQSQSLTITGQTSLEAGFTVSPTSNISGTGSIVTVVQASHGLNTGEYIQSAGSSTAGYNVDPVQITRVDANTFTFAGTGTGTPVTAPTIKRYSVVTLESVLVEVIR